MQGATASSTLRNVSRASPSAATKFKWVTLVNLPRYILPIDLRRMFDSAQAGSGMDCTAQIHLNYKNFHPDGRAYVLFKPTPTPTSTTPQPSPSPTPHHDPSRDRPWTDPTYEAHLRGIIRNLNLNLSLPSSSQSQSQLRSSTAQARYFAGPTFIPSHADTGSGPSAGLRDERGRSVYLEGLMATTGASTSEEEVMKGLRRAGYGVESVRWIDIERAAKLQSHSPKQDYLITLESPSEAQRLVRKYHMTIPMERGGNDVVRARIIH